LAKELVVAPTQFSAADTVRVALEAVGQSDLDTIEAATAPDVHLRFGDADPTEVHHRRLAGCERNVPYCNAFRVTDGLVQDYRVYLDANPVIVAAGGPVGVGEGVGRSMRFWLVSVQVVVLAAALALYGVDPDFALMV
jgi:ketosteroid isomerase-like protein